MSYAISLSGPAFEREAWVRELGERMVGSRSSPSAHISPLFYHWYDPWDTLRDPSGFWILPRGGIRGVTVSHRGETSVVSIPAGNSDSDFAMAWDLVRRGLRHGASASSEDEPVLDGSEEQCSAIARRVTDHQWKAVLAGFPREESISISVRDKIHLTLPRIASTLGPAFLMRHFSERMDAYADACHAIPEARPGDQGIRMVSTYSRLPTLMDSRTEEVHLDGACLKPGNKSLLAIDADHFHACFGGQVEHLGGYHHVPAASDIVLERLLVAAREKSSRVKRAWLKREIPAPFFPPPISRNRPLEMPNGEWLAHLRAPCMVYLLVNGLRAVREADQVAVFRMLMEHLPDASGPLVRRIFDSSRANADEIFQTLAESGEEPAPALADYGNLIHSGRLSRSHTREIAGRLVILARTIARHRKKIAPVNQASLTRIGGLIAALELELIR